MYILPDEEKMGDINDEETPKIPKRNRDDFADTRKNRVWNFNLINFYIYINLELWD